MLRRVVLAVCAVLPILLLSAGRAAGPGVTYERLVHASSEPQNWLTYWGDYSATRHRTLAQITTANVKDLRVAWINQSGKPGSLETMPIVVDGTMYITAGEGVAVALDASSGRELWHYAYTFPANENTGQPNRGFAILGQRLYMVTPHAHVVALDTRDGHQIWDSQMAPFVPNARYATLAPLAIRNRVVVGISGGEFGERGFIEAYDAESGKRVWRFYTVPLPTEPGGDTWPAGAGERGGGPAWMTGTFDPTLNTVYWGTGNPSPDLYGPARTGDNLYTCSLVALDPDTGTLKWYFQFNPHDTHDWDAAETPMLLDLPVEGKLRKLVVQANRNAFFYILDRTTGEFIKGYPFARQTWAKGLDAKGRPIELPDITPTAEGTRVCPGLTGATNWMAPSFDPGTGLFYVAVREQCDLFYSSKPAFEKGKPYWGGFPRGVTDETAYGMLKAFDPLTGEERWHFRFAHAGMAGTLSTGNLVFAADDDGYLMAFDGRTGENLWYFNTGGRIVNSPMTYMAGGKQYVAIAAAGAIVACAMPD